MCGFRRNRSCSFFVGIAVFRQERQAALYNRRLGCVGISLIYTILGIVYAEAVEVIISEEELSVSVSTYSYFSFVAVLVAGVLYFVTAPNFATAPKTDKVAKSSQSQILEEKELKTVEVLLRYKELFDRGVITEQEYENKKRALLGESKENS